MPASRSVPPLGAAGSTQSKWVKSGPCLIGPMVVIACWRTGASAAAPEAAPGQVSDCRYRRRGEHVDERRPSVPRSRDRAPFTTPHSARCAVAHSTPDPCASVPIVSGPLRRCAQYTWKHENGKPVARCQVNNRPSAQRRIGDDAISVQANGVDSGAQGGTRGERTAPGQVPRERGRADQLGTATGESDSVRR